MNEWMDGWTDEWMDGCVNEASEQMDTSMNE